MSNEMFISEANEEELIKIRLRNIRSCLYTIFPDEYRHLMN